MHNLPASLSRFIGRKQELQELRGLFEGVRLLTLVGVGGSGKSRLALELARQLENRFPDGVWFVELSPLAEPALVPVVVARRLGIAAESQRPVTETLVHALMGNRMLLLLDNCEHLADACASLIRSVLEGCPDLRVIATSRQRLRLPGERTWTVPALSLPADQVRFTSLARSEAVQLFVDRASLAGPGFELNAANAGVIASICRRLDGIPLSIELAAARRRLMSEDEILAGLTDSLKFLTGGTPTGPSRQRTLRATIDWSYGLLTELEQALFRRLAVFAGGFTLEHAARVGSDGRLASETVLDLVGALVDKSLVEPIIRGGGQTRYRLLETLREYAVERLVESGERDPTRRRHAEYFLDWVEITNGRLDGAEQREWLDWLDADHDNLRGALEWARAADQRLVSRLAAALGSFWNRRGYVSEGTYWLTQGLVAETEPTDLRARLLASAGLLAWRTDDFPAAIRASAEVVGVARRAGDEQQLAWALDLYGFVLAGASQLAAARPVVAEAIRTARRAGDPLLLGGAVNTAGILSLHLGEFAKAKRLLRRSRDAARKACDWSSLAAASSVLGWGQLQSGELTGARASLAEALELRLELGDRPGLASSLDYFAELLSREGKRERALRLIGASDRIYRTCGSTPPSLAVASRRQWLEAASKALGNRTKSILHSGGQLALEQAVTEALEGPDRSAGPRPGDEGPAELSPRERFVARLVADGLTNRQIANRLSLGQRTVDAHVEHIFNKLSLHSRAQIGAWVARHVQRQLE
jgi:predicted ATPase/DNA-binding CsgD family transcriptional regulator